MAGGINYGRIMLRAGHRVIHDVLGEVAENGLPSENKLVIKFETSHPGVDMADWLRERHDGEMVILLDQWFDDLAVMGDRFQVTLNFSDSPQTLVVPFAAILEFTDPGVGWGLAFHGIDPEDAPVDEAARRVEIEAGEGEGDGPDDDPGPGASVVQLDRFRRS